MDAKDGAAAPEAERVNVLELQLMELWSRSEPTERR